MTDVLVTKSLYPQAARTSKIYHEFGRRILLRQLGGNNRDELQMPSPFGAPAYRATGALEDRDCTSKA